jgi:hypothetical protein
MVPFLLPRGVGWQEGGEIDGVSMVLQVYGWAVAVFETSQVLFLETWDASGWEDILERWIQSVGDWWGGAQGAYNIPIPISLTDSLAFLFVRRLRIWMKGLRDNGSESKLT